MEIEVKPRLSRSPRKDAERIKTEALNRRTTTNERGFFQLQGLAPGAYIIHAKKEPFALTTASVRVKPDRATELVDPPLILREPRSLQIYLEPPIPLPSTYLDGIVVDERDLPVPGAIVTVRSYDLLLDSFTQQGTDSSGSFEFLGLPPGEIVLRAAKMRESKRFHSPKVVVEIEEEIESESLKLVLREELRLRGRVVAYGRGIPGANVKAHSTTAMDLSVSKKNTDADGYFEISVPPDSQEVLLGIGAPGFGYKMARSRLTPGQDFIISLEQAAGTLVIELEKNAAERPRTQILAVLHNGSMEAADYLQRVWAPLNGIVERDPDRYVLPWLEAGEYSVCVTDPVQLDQLVVSGTGGGACPGGYLPAGGELVVVLRRSQ